AGGGGKNGPPVLNVWDWARGHGGWGGYFGRRGNFPAATKARWAPTVMWEEFGPLSQSVKIFRLFGVGHEAKGGITPLCGAWAAVALRSEITLCKRMRVSKGGSGARNAHNAGSASGPRCFSARSAACRKGKLLWFRSAKRLKVFPVHGRRKVLELFE